MNDNDIIAEYIKKKYPELLKSTEFAFYKIGFYLRDFSNRIIDAFKGIDMKELQKLNEVKNDINED